MIFKLEDKSLSTTVLISGETYVEVKFFVLTKLNELEHELKKYQDGNSSLSLEEVTKLRLSDTVEMQLINNEHDTFSDPVEVLLTEIKNGPTNEYEIIAALELVPLTEDIVYI